MRTSFLRRLRGPLSRSNARNAAFLNLCATPGLGSLMAGRLVAGIGQLLLAVAGFVMVLGWFALFLLQTYNQFVNDAQPKPVAWLGEAGALTFAVAWVWSLVTSLRILSSAKEPEAPNVPPRLM